jgi:hypothetical protein
VADLMAAGAEAASAAACANAAWCDAVCAAHGAPGERSAFVWRNRHPVPAFYPNLVTLSPDIAAALDAVRELETHGLRAGWGVKDSFRTLSLDRLGFGVLFDGEWIVHPAARRRPIRSEWERISTAEALAEWEAAWTQSRGKARIFLPALLERPDVAFLAMRRARRIAGGLVAFRTAEGVTLSNAFGAQGAALEAGVEAASDHFPDLPLFGWEPVEDLPHWRAMGFRSVGPLRVWTRR